jgi:hypothetical protein
MGENVNFSNLALAAKRLIGDNGTKVVLRNTVGNSVYNPATNQYETQEILFNGLAIIANYNDNLIDGTVIRSGDRKVKAVLDGEPKAGTSKLDIYNNEGVKIDTLQIINVMPVNPNASITIMYNLQCRK